MKLYIYDKEVHQWAEIEADHYGEVYNPRRLEQLLKNAKWHKGYPPGYEEEDDDKFDDPVKVLENMMHELVWQRIQQHMTSPPRSWNKQERRKR